jgi:hypothetical protein
MEIDQLVEEIRTMTPNEVRKAVAKLPERVDLRKKAEELCYDRVICKALGINYNEVPEEDYLKAYLFAYKTQEAKP